MYKNKTFVLVTLILAAFSLVYAVALTSKQSSLGTSVSNKSQTAALTCTGCYFVSSTGNDTGAGTETSPFRTIARGVSALGAGGTLYIRGGTYHEQVYVSKSGTASGPITIESYPGEEAVIDGQFTLPSGGTYRNYGNLFRIEGSYIVLKNVKITQSAGMGLVITGSYNVIEGVKAHKNNENGILVTGSGTRNTVQNSEVWYNAMSNENYKCTTATCFNWPSGLSAARAPSYTTFRNNKVWENWGEGMSSYESDYTVMEGNQVFNNKDNVYLSDTRYSVLNGNLIYSTVRNPLSPELFPESIQDKTAQNGIMMGDETSNNPSTDNIVTNNLVYGNYKNFNYWGSLTSRGLVNATIAYNTFIDSGINGESSGSNIAMNPGAGVTSSNSRFENNVILQQHNTRISGFTNLAGITLANNVWNIAPISGMLGTGDKVGDPLITRTGSVIAGQLSGEYFKISSNSPARNMGTAVRVSVSKDYFGTSRPQGIAMDRGGHEYVETTQPPQPVDNIAPLISMTDPSAGVSLQGTVSISTNASDNVAIAGVKFFVNDLAIGEDTTAPYSLLWNTLSYVDGPYTIKAVARDTSQNTAEITRNVIVGNSVVPPITIGPDVTPPTIPTNLMGTAASSGQVNLSWSLSVDPTISGAETSGVLGYKVYKNNVFIANVTGGATSFQNNTGLVANTAYTFQVSAYDNDYNESVKSTSISVTTLPAPSTGIQIGDKVQTTAKLKVRATASNKGTVLGTQQRGASGTVIAGPAYANGYVWWRVDYDYGTDGWSAGNWLREI